MTEGGPDLTRVALYARYSSPLQKPTSIDDQLRECQRYVRGRAGQVVARYSDKELSGDSSIHTRPGIQTLLSDCSLGYYTAVCIEALDRITRNQGDIAYIYEQLSFDDVQIVTPRDGIINPYHVGLTGTMNAMFLRNLSDKTRRGQKGAVSRGHMIARAPFGYRNANRLEGSKHIRGLREIDPDQAEVVRRIFHLYANGTSAKAIARLLNEEGVPTPGGGKQWRHTGLVGRGSKSTMLTNRIYIGEMVYGTTHAVRHPTTRRSVRRPTPEDEWEIFIDPELRIVDENTWNTVQDKILAASQPRTPPPGITSMPKGAKPLTPLLRCPRCQGPINSLARHRWACNASRARKGCNTPTFVLRDLEVLVARRLAQWIRRRRNWHTVLQQALSQLAQRRHTLQTRIDRNRLQTRRLIEAIQDGEKPPSIVQEIAALDREHAMFLGHLAEATTSRLPSLPSGSIRPALLQQASELQEATQSPQPHTRFRAALQLSQLLDSIDLSAGAQPGKPKMRIHPNVLAVVDWTTGSMRHLPDRDHS